jgi:hypothetical protein
MVAVLLQEWLESTGTRGERAVACMGAIVPRPVAVERQGTRCVAAHLSESMANHVEKEKIIVFIGGRNSNNGQERMAPEFDFGHSLNLSLRHEVARLIVWRVVRTRPAVPSAVSYEDVREGNDPYRALGHGTHSLLTGACTVREGRICQHQAETGLDGWYGEHM